MHQLYYDKEPVHKKHFVSFWTHYKTPINDQYVIIHMIKFLRFLGVLCGGPCCSDCQLLPSLLLTTHSGPRRISVTLANTFMR